MSVRPGADTLRSEADMRWKLEQMANFYGTQDRLAQHLGVSPQYLCDILKGRRGLSGKVAQRIGYRRVVGFVETKGTQHE